MASSSHLFKPLPIGPLTLQHRLVMAPLTRFRADASHIQLPFVPEYYAQRASVPGTLLITEATFIHALAGGYDNVPGIYTPAQITAWKAVTAAVHAKGSFIFCQLWALGRTAAAAVCEKEDIPLLSASDVPMTPKSPAPTPMNEADIQRFVGFYAQAARNAVEAGFDGVEIHGANGYLIDQFTQSVSNRRTDAYGGSVERRSRFALEVAAAVSEAVGAERVGIRLSPFSTFQGMKMEKEEIVPQFAHLIAGLKGLGLGYVHLVEPRISGNVDVDAGAESLGPLLETWGKGRPVLVAGGFKPESARRLVDEEYPGYEVAVVFGRYFISNPDLPFRVRQGVELADYNRQTFYNPMSKEGYVDYPFSQEFLDGGEARL